MANKLKKELKEWIILLSVLAILFFTGWYKDVAGLLQRGLLETGILQPSLTEHARPASYDFQLLNESGTMVHFSEFKGKTVLMNFWATWCPPCIAEMPDINDLYGKVSEDVSFVMISVDEDQEMALRFVERRGFAFPIYFLKTNLPNTYETSSIPSTFVLSPQGEIVAEQHGLSKYDTENFRNFLLSLNKGESPS